ncbi:MAG: hypothetical protein WC565_09545 [Parcubacteria group bacterium]|jgi:hypothetical protein
MLYEIAAITKPTDREEEEGVVAAIVLEPMVIVAQDETAAVLKIVQGGKLSGCDMDRVQVLVRPF